MMINTAEQTTTECLACGSPIIQLAGRGHRKRLYCDDRCRQRAHRAKRQGKAAFKAHGDLQQRIADLERELAQAHHLIDTYIHRKRTPQGWKEQLQRRFLQLGSESGWPALTIPIHVQPGERAYRVFALAASNELLSEGGVTLRNRNQS